MGKMIVDESLRNQLSQAQEEMEFLDQKGAQVGYFFPAHVYFRMMRAWARAEFADDPDLPKARKEVGGMTTAEVLRHLKEVEAWKQRP